MKPIKKEQSLKDATIVAGRGLDLAARIQAAIPSYPQILKMENRPMVLLDVPGFQDLRGMRTLEEINAALSLAILFHNSKKDSAPPKPASEPTQ